MEGLSVNINVEDLVKAKSTSGGQVIPLSYDHGVINVGSIHDDEAQANSGEINACTSGMGHLQEPNPLDSWLPLTESRNGSTWTAALLLLSSGIGFQSLSLPVALVSLGWYWGIICLTVGFVWQLYTIGLLVNLHESVPPGIRYSRFLHLSITAFGAKLGKLLALFPVLYLSGATCSVLIINGGGTLRQFYHAMCGDYCTKKLLTGAEWNLVFICLAILVAQFCPNLHSVAKVSIIGATTGVGYCTLLWIVSIVKDRPDGISYGPNAAPPERTGVFGIFNAFGLIALAFRGHNVVLEIQGTMPSSQKRPSKVPMHRGVTISYILIAGCFFPLAIAGYWAYGNKMITTGGVLNSLMQFHGDSMPKSVKAIIYLLLVINYIAVFQVYAMVVFDNLERIYVTKKNRRCPRWLRSGLRVLFGGLTYFIAVALPFLGILAPLLGGLMAVPLTFAYPCFMWMAIKKPRRSNAMWWLNLGAGCLGIILSVLVVIAGIRNLAVNGLDANFFKP